MDRQELINELAATAKAIADKWGAKVNTPTGCIKFSWSGAHQLLTISRNVSAWPWELVVLKHYSRGWDITDLKWGIDTLLAASGWLQGIALYLASKDFTDKVKGSIGTLKRVQRALAG